MSRADSTGSCSRWHSSASLKNSARSPASRGSCASARNLRANSAKSSLPAMRMKRPGAAASFAGILQVLENPRLLTNSNSLELAISRVNSTGCVTDASGWGKCQRTGSTASTARDRSVMPSGLQRTAMLKLWLMLATSGHIPSARSGSAAGSSRGCPGNSADGHAEARAAANDRQMAEVRGWSTGQALGGKRKLKSPAYSSHPCCRR